MFITVHTAGSVQFIVIWIIWCDCKGHFCVCIVIRKLYYDGHIFGVKWAAVIYRRLHVEVSRLRLRSYLVVRLEEPHGDVVPEAVSRAVGKDAQLGDDHRVKDLEVQTDGRDIGRQQRRRVRNAQYGHLLPSSCSRGQRSDNRISHASAWILELGQNNTIHNNNNNNSFIWFFVVYISFYNIILK